MDIFEEKSNLIETGDILLMKCNEGFSLFVRQIINSNWSHVAIAVWLKTNESYDFVDNNIELYENTNDNSNKDLFLFESSEGSSYDILTREIRFGCRLIRLRDVIKYYDQIAVRKVNLNRNKFYYDNLTKFIKSYKGVSYETSIVQFISNGLNLSISKPDGDLVCSDLVARYLKYFKLIPDWYSIDFPTYSYAPNDFSAIEKGQNKGKLRPIIFKGDEIMVYNFENEFIYTYGSYFLLLIILIILLVVRIIKK